MAWLNPVALAGLIALAGPVLIHLLRRQRARRMPFPSLRFVRPARSVASRMRRITDPWLLLVRLAILALAACALAQPVLLLPGRVATWNARTARAIVVDASESMRLHGAERSAAEAADAEAASSVASVRIDAPDLGDGVRRAVGWLATAPPARRELAIVSDLQAGALRRSLLDTVPAHIGIRFLAVGAAPGAHEFTGAELAGTGAVQRVGVTPDRTALRVEPGTPSDEGLRLVVPAGREDARARILRAIAAAQTPRPSSARPIVAVFGHARIADPLAPVRAGWMRATLVRLAQDKDVRDAARDGSPQGTPDDPAWAVVVRTAAGEALIRASASGPSLVLHVADDPESFLAAAVVRAALMGRPVLPGAARAGADSPGPALEEHEIARTPARDLAAWSREPGSVGPGAVAHIERSDARWCWVAVLALLAIETWMRRSGVAARQEAQVDAA